MAQRPSNLSAAGQILNDPSTGPSPVVDPSAENPQELSPTTMVLNYLKARGYQPTTENVRRALEANAWNPGAISGLRSDVAAIDPTDTGGSKKTSAPPSNTNVDSGRVSVEGQVGPGSGSTGLSPNQPPPRALDWLREVGPTAPAPTLPPPADGATVGSTGPATMPPRTGAAVALPDPIAEAVTKALSGPPGQLALPAPEGQNMPRIEGPAPQLALPAPSGQPALPAPTPGLGGIPNTPPQANTAPQGEPGGQVRLGNVQMKPAPGPQVQGYPIQEGPFLGPLRRGVVGGVAGSRGGIPGAIIGAAPGAIDLGKYIAKNLHLY